MLTVSFLNWKREEKFQDKIVEIEKCRDLALILVITWAARRATAKSVEPIPRALHFWKLSGFLEPGRQQKSRSSWMNPLQWYGVVRCGTVWFSAAGASPSRSTPTTLDHFVIAQARRGRGSHTRSVSVALDFCKHKSTQKFSQVKWPS